MRVKWTTCLLICLALSGVSVTGSSETEVPASPGTPVVNNAVMTPNEVVATASTAIAKQLDGRKEYLKENTTELYDMIDDVLLPHFDTRFAGRLVLGNHWRSATEEQRARFIEVFYRFLVQSYADGILGFEQDTLNILPQEAGEPDEKRAIVKTTIRMDDGTEVPVNYSMRNSADGWRVYDVRIEGVSYIQNYRNQLNAEIKALGLDAVIERLRAEIEAAKA